MIRKLLVADEDLKKIEEDKNHWSVLGLETGGYIFGRLYSNGLGHVIRVTDGGPHASRTPVSFSGDSVCATQVKEQLQEEDPEIRLLGEYHVHPWAGQPSLSGGDVNQLLEAKRARPWFVVLLSTEENSKVFDLKVQTPEDARLASPLAEQTPFQNRMWKPRSILCDITEVPYQNVKNVMPKEQLLDRILSITRNDLLLEKTVLLVGLGSGGSTIAKYLGCTGIGRFILVDDEQLEIPNLIRHEGSIDDLGKSKTEICKSIIESHNPFSVVEPYNFDATKDVDKLEKLIPEANLIIGSSGSVKVNNLLNKFSIEQRLPAVYGGVYERASGAYVLAVKPYETACFNCLFGITSQSYSVDKEAAQSYGLSEDSLHQQQGLWMDISFPSLMLSKMALAILEEKELNYNLALYDSSMEIRKLSVARSKDCAVCNEESWLRSHEQSGEGGPDTQKEPSIMEKLRRKLRWRI